MALNLGALKTVQGDLNKRGNTDLFFRQKSIGEETDVRILPPFANMNEMYFIEVIGWWVGNMFYISPETFGEECPMQAIFDEAKNSSDKDLIALASDRDKIKKASQFWMPILLLTPVMEKGVAVDFTVVDDKAKILDAGPMLMKRINKVVTSRQAQNGTPDGITDRVKGSNLILSKTGVKMNTEYDAVLGDSIEFDAKYYKEYPNVVELAEKSLRPNDYLESVVNNYFYGDEILPDPLANKDKSEGGKTPEKGAASTRTGRSAAAESAQVGATRISRTAKSQPEEDDDDKPAAETKPTRTTRKAATSTPAAEKKTPGASRPARGLMEDLENLDD